MSSENMSLKFHIFCTVCTFRLTALSLYMTPLQSSFAKPQTPTDIGKLNTIMNILDQCLLTLSVGLVQHRFVAWLYMLLELSVPAVVYAALSYNRSLQSGLVSEIETHAC